MTLGGVQLLLTPKSKSKLCYNHQSVSHPVLVSSPLSASTTTFFVTVRKWQVCRCGAPSLMTGRVCRLQLLLAITSAVILGSDDHILLSQIQD
jgi:hypothetical protein